MTQLNPEDVRRVAGLANLHLDESQIPAMQEQLGRILTFIDQLEEVDTSGVEPLAHPFELVNAFREDVPTPMLPREEALKNAPSTDGKYFQVPAILDAED